MTNKPKIKTKKKKTPDIPTPGNLVNLPEEDPTIVPGLSEDPLQSSDEEVFEEDFTDDDDEFPIAEEGVHHAKVIDFEKSESQAGNMQYVWQFRITAGKSKDIELKFWTSLLPQAHWKAAETLAAVGIKAAGSIAKFSKSDIVGKPCIIVVVHETYEGRLTNKVKKVHPPNKESIEFVKTDDDIPF